MQIVQLPPKIFHSYKKMNKVKNKINCHQSNKLKIVFHTHLINNPKMFNGETDDLAIKPCIPHKSLLQ